MAAKVWGHFSVRGNCHITAYLNIAGDHFRERLILHASCEKTFWFRRTDTIKTMIKTNNNDKNNYFWKTDKRAKPSRWRRPKKNWYFFCDVWNSLWCNPWEITERKKNTTNKSTLSISRRGRYHINIAASTRTLFRTTGYVTKIPAFIRCCHKILDFRVAILKLKKNTTRTSISEWRISKWRNFGCIKNRSGNEDPKKLGKKLAISAWCDFEGYFKWSIR